MMSKKINTKWFGPAKASNSGFGVYSWRGWASILVFMVLVIVDVVSLSRYLVLAIIVAIVLLVGFMLFALKHSAKFTNGNLR